MDRNDSRYAAFIDILRGELVPALGCTEPIALAFAGAKAREALIGEPVRIDAFVSANIIKNVKSVAVPNAGGLKGIAAAVAVGAIAGDASLALEVLRKVTPKGAAAAKAFLEKHEVTVSPADSDEIFYIDIRIASEAHTARVVITRAHTHITRIERDGAAIFEAGDDVGGAEQADAAYALLSVRAIFDFAETVDLADVEPILRRQIEYNMAIADEGLAHPWGANVGSVLRSAHADDDLCILAASAAAAGSDARMSGCELPVIIVSGSGNQGITASVPVIVYARALGVPEERLLRALVISNLTTIHQKTGIGRLSAFCGATSAGGGAAAGVAYVSGGGYTEIIHTLCNAIGMLSGMVCDGAKPSCAAKIAASVQAGILGYQMFMAGTEFKRGDGIIGGDIESTIQNVGEMASLGMRDTAREILRIMTEDC